MSVSGRRWSCWILCAVGCTVWGMQAPAQSARELRRAEADAGAVAGAEDTSAADLEALRLLRRAQDLLLAGEKDRGVRMLESVAEQFPESPVRYQAFMALGKHYQDEREHAQAVPYFGRLRELEAHEKLPQAQVELLVESLYLTGVSYYETRQFSKAFPVLRKVTIQYPNTAWANQAYYYIGMCHFMQERWNQAVDALQMVGTYVDPSGTAVEYAEAGRRLYVKVQDGDLPVLHRLGVEVNLRLDTASGDEETIRALPLAAGSETFIASIPTAVGVPVKGDGTLQVIGGDTVHVAYTDVNTEQGEKDLVREASVKMVSTAGMFFSLGNFETRSEIGFVGQPVFLVLTDADLDVSPKADTAVVRVFSRYKIEDMGDEPTGAGEGFTEFLKEEEKEKYRIRDEVSLVFEEQGTNEVVRSGRFLGRLRTSARATDAEVDRTDDVLACAPGDEVMAIYMDERHGGGEFAREVVARIVMGGEIDTSPRASQSVVTDETIRARKNLVEAQAYLELGAIFRDMGLTGGAGERADEGIERAEQVILTQVAIPSDLRERAFKLKWELHILKKEYDKAIETCRSFNQLFPHSPFVDEALLGIGRIRMESGQYTEALKVFQQILGLQNSMAKAEAQFRIAETTERLNPLAPESAIGLYKLTADRYRDSAFAGPSLGKLIDYHIETRDYSQATALLGQVFQDYPDADFLDAMLLKWVLVAYRMGEFRTAHEKCSRLIFEYPDTQYAQKAKEILPQIESRL